LDSEHCVLSLVDELVDRVFSISERRLQSDISLHDLSNEVSNIEIDFKEPVQKEFRGCEAGIVQNYNTMCPTKIEENNTFLTLEPAIQEPMEQTQKEPIINETSVITSSDMICPVNVKKVSQIIVTGLSDLSNEVSEVKMGSQEPLKPGQNESLVHEIDVEQKFHTVCQKNFEEVIQPLTVIRECKKGSQEPLEPVLKEPMGYQTKVQKFDTLYPSKVEKVSQPSTFSQVSKYSDLSNEVCEVGESSQEPMESVSKESPGYETKVAKEFDTLYPSKIEEVFQPPEGSQGSKFIKKAITGVLWTFTVYGIYKALEKTGIPNLITRAIPQSK